MKATIKSAKKKAWTTFSKYIRLRDCLRATGTKTEGICVTCKCKFPFKKLQAGHFIPGRRKGILFNEKAVHAQCVGCNMFRNGEMPLYEEFMRETYGQETIDKLWAEARKLLQWKVFQLEEINEIYKNKIKELEAK